MKPCGQRGSQSIISDNLKLLFWKDMFLLVNCLLASFQWIEFSVYSRKKSRLYYATCVLTFVSPVQLFVTQWTIACQAPLSLGFSRQEYWSGLPSPSLGDLPDLGMEPRFLMSLALASAFFTTSATWETR